MNRNPLLLLTGLLCLTTQTALSQKNLSGTITNENGVPLDGAHIRIKDSYKGSFSKDSGVFKIRNLKRDSVEVSVSYIGYKTKTKGKALQEGSNELSFTLKKTTFLAQEVTISATQVSEKTPIAHTNVDQASIQKNNTAADMPYVLNHTPSTVVSSDAGTGVGYTQLRIRGSSPTRINVTINGIPLNDAESQGVYWVDIPDLAASTDQIQIQRGVGSSTNGAGAFGGTVNIRTLEQRTEPYGRTSHTFGSFNTRKHNVSFGTGLLKDHWSFEGRLSKMKSDGYIDRATADVSSYYFSGGYRDETTSVKFITFSGKEKTYQAWYGMPKASLDTNRTFNPYNYDNETDNYTQTHYQLHFDQQLHDNLTLNAALHYTKGKGYYEQYKGKDHNNTISSAGKANLADYSFEPVVVGGDTIRRTDLIQRRWLDNDFYGGTWSLKYRDQKLKATLGGAVNQYFGRHYGEVIWARYMSNGDIRDRYYDNEGLKNDLNTYLKLEYEILPGLYLFGDAQYRHVDYHFLGVDHDGSELEQDVALDFFNPKAGLHYDINPDNRIWASWSVGNKEPNRTDYVDAPPNNHPSPETLHDYELGYERRGNNYLLKANVYYMDYQDHLVETGELNEVGRVVRTNVENSFRRGIELTGGVRVLEWLDWNANATFSQNKVVNYSQYVDNWNTGEQVEINHGTSDLAFSPSIIASSNVKMDLLSGGGEQNHHDVSVEWTSKYVGEQYIDNSSSPDRKLDDYLVNSLRLTYEWNPTWVGSISFSFMARNILDEKYVTKAWVYRYKLGEDFQQMGGYFPQAGRNYLGRMMIKF